MTSEYVMCHMFVFTTSSPTSPLISRDMADFNECDDAELLDFLIEAQKICGIVASKKFTNLGRLPLRPLNSPLMLLGICEEIFHEFSFLGLGDCDLIEGYETVRRDVANFAMSAQSNKQSDVSNPLNETINNDVIDVLRRITALVCSFNIVIPNVAISPEVLTD